MNTLHKELHKELHIADFCVSEKNQDAFTRHEVESYHDLGLVLKQIHERLRDEIAQEKLGDLIVRYDARSDLEIKTNPTYE